MQKNKFFILDAYALIFRSYYAFINNPRYNSKGLNTSAIFGFLNTLDEILKKEEPTHIAVCFDAPAATFRKEIYPEYKANRDATPEDIKKSIPYIKDILKGYKIPILEQVGFEADDLAGSLSKKFSSEKYEIYLMTSDKDYLQLIDKNTSVYKPKSKKNDVQIITPVIFKEKYGLKNPEQYIEVLALAGDTADNVPGIPGIGEVTALKLLNKFGSIEDIYKNIDILSPKQREKFIDNKDLLDLSKKLVTIKTDIDISLTDDDIKIKAPNIEELTNLFDELEFNKTAERVLSKPKAQAQQNIFGNNDEQTQIIKQLKTIKDINPDYKLIEADYEFDDLIKELEQSSEIAFDTETTSVDAHSANIVGISFSTKENSAYYIPLPKDFNQAKNTLNLFKPVFENPKILKIGQNLKYDLNILLNYEIDVKGKLFDTMIAHSLIEPQLKHNMDYLAETYLNYKTIHIDELIGKKGAHQRNMSDLNANKIKDYAAEDADITYKLKQIFAKKIIDQNLTKIFETVEMPLVTILTKMEHNGILIDQEFLKNYRKILLKKAISTENKIYELSGAQFNISSPKQLGEILFKKLKISENPKLTKTKQYATDEAELLKYRDNHKIVDIILEYRSLSKLISTYVDALPKLVNKKTQRIHTSFNQYITVTGRLSSNNPNLQNIPIRTPEGREIRKAFIPAEGHIFIDADYSQVELRLMAHLSQDPNMLEAFQNGIDIHTQTAAKVFNISLDEVKPEMRYQAKTANFAMIYGSSAFGLSRNLNISSTEAKTLIDNYFKTYPGVKKYMDEQIKKARNEEFVTTLMGRKRVLIEINSRNSLIRSNAEHNAINTPIQGSAADIIKLAMINIQGKIEQLNLKSKMLLQVHDELLFEVPENEKQQMFELIKYEMENAVSLSVPLLVDISTGKNWAEAH
ncbi:MAG: DNA polymerase I [Bacteroidales bacterium]|nr:DNA polymerase I [Bacteroidales bacterium]